MRVSLFKKAKALKVELETESDKRIICKVGEGDNAHQVIIEYQDYDLKHLCDCKHMAVRQPTNLCSHKIAVISHLVGLQ